MPRHYASRRPLAAKKKKKLPVELGALGKRNVSRATRRRSIKAYRAARKAAPHTSRVKKAPVGSKSNPKTFSTSPRGISVSAPVKKTPFKKKGFTPSRSSIKKGRVSLSQFIGTKSKPPTGSKKKTTSKSRNTAFNSFLSKKTSSVKKLKGKKPSTSSIFYKNWLKNRKKKRK